MEERRPWTPDDISKLRSMARKYPTTQIARELKRGHSATVMKARLLRIFLSLNPKRGSRPANVSLDPVPAAMDVPTSDPGTGRLG
jgi:hypothetical protein